MKKKSRDNKVLIDSLIPLGMIFGCAIGVIVNSFFEIGFLAFSISIGAGIGCLFGAIAYGIYNKNGNS